jgi:hypothetical protein
LCGSIGNRVHDSAAAVKAVSIAFTVSLAPVPLQFRVGGIPFSLHLIENSTEPIMFR